MRWNYQVTTCSQMFMNLNNISSIDLSNFDASKVENFSCMFLGCTSLKSINLNNVNTSSAINMAGMFDGCSGLETLNLSSFYTSNVTYMNNMFNGCTSLKSLDLSNFKTPELEDTRFMFQLCSSLVLLNLINFDTSKITKSEWMFLDVNENLIYCADESKIANIKLSSSYSYIEDYTNNCNHSCFINSQSKYIIEKNECIDNCTNDKNYSYEYNNNCYKSCPIRTNISPNNSHLCEDIICPKYYYFDEFNNYNCTNECTDKYNKIIIEKGKCIDDCSKDKKYKFEFNKICYSTNIVFNKCSIYELSNGLCKLKSNNNGNNKEEKDAIVSNIRELISKGELDSILLNKTNENNKGVVIKEESTVYQIVSLDYHNNSREDNISIVELGECENDLRSHYNITKNDSLLIFKMDIHEEGSLTPRTEYEVYDSKSKEQLDLSICNLNRMNILVPVKIEIDDIYKFNSSSDYYKDICYTHTTDHGTDITLADRKKEFISNNMSLCGTECEFGGYDSDIKKAKCECEIIFNFKHYIKNTVNVNFKIMKCYKTAFSSKGLKGNIGNYIILSFILTISICLVRFLKKGFSIIKGYINEIDSCKNPNNNIITKKSEQQSESNDGGNAKIIKKVKRKKEKKKTKRKTK